MIVLKTDSSLEAVNMASLLDVHCSLYFKQANKTVWFNLPSLQKLTTVQSSKTASRAHSSTLSDQLDAFQNIKPLSAAARISSSGSERKKNRIN
jgi:hypothetical protein